MPGIIGCLQALEVNMFVFVGCSAWNHRLSASLGSECLYLLAAVPGIIGCLQALEVIKLATGSGCILF